MRPFILSVLTIATATFSAPFRILVDEPGRWEIEWSAKECRVAVLADGARSYVCADVPSSDVPGDLLSGRLTGRIALPSGAAWKLEMLLDSGTTVSGGRWKRVSGWDRSAAKPIEAAPRDRDGWSESRMDGFRLLSMDFPLAVPVDGGVRLREKVRLRLSWQGRATLPSGSVWKGIVDNPRGIKIASAFASRRGRASGAQPGGTMLSVRVGDDDPFSSAEDGVVRLKGSQLSKIAGGWAFSNIAVYSGISDTAPSAMDDSLVAPGLRAIPILRVDRNRDGMLDQDDEIWFWGRGPNLWKPIEGISRGWRYSINPYSRKREFLVRLDAPDGSPELAVGPKGADATRFESVLQPTWVGKPDKLKDVVIGSVPMQTETDLGKEWYWIGADAEGAVTVPLEGLSFPGRIGDSAWARPRIATTGWFLDGADRIDLFGIAGKSSRWSLADSTDRVWAGTGLDASTKAFDFSFSGFHLAIAGVDLAYRRDLSKSDSALFPAPAQGSLDIKVASNGRCWVLEEGVAVRACSIEGGRLRDSARIADTWYAVFPDATTGSAVSVAAWSPPTQSHVVKDFATDRAADILVVAPDAMLGVAEDYALHREADFQVRKMKVAIVRTEDAYQLWSGGQMDPNGIRNAIRWAHGRWGVSHVLLMGAGHVDPRLAMGDASDVLVPQWEDGPMATDDYFGYLASGDPTVVGTAHAMDVAVGRVPARSVPEAKAWLAKLKVFEDPSRAEFGPWRNTVVLAADDVWQGVKPDGIGNHTNQMEDVADAMLALRPWLRLEKLYLVDYPVNGIRQKPEAARDLQNLLNRGAIGFSYLGHGGLSVLADENLMDISVIDRTLVNARTPYLFFAGSCTVGRNDVPNARGLTEAMVVASGKGAVSGIAGTRPTYPDGNQRISAEFWRRVVDTLAPVTIGEALVGSKAGTGGGLVLSYSNQDAYNLLGDPAIVLVPGGIRVDLDSIRDTIAALSRIQLRGKTGKAANFQVRLELQPDQDTAAKASEAQDFQVYRLSPSQMLALQSKIAGDSLAATLQIPARIAFGDSAVLRVYAWNPATRGDGGRVLAPRVLFGTDSAGTIESDGPQIAVRPCDSSWSGGVAYGKSAKIPVPFCITVDLFDSSGISSETGPDEGVVFAVPGVRDPWHPDLRQDADFRRASAQFVIDSTTMGAGNTYSFDVSARDLMGNLARARVQLEVTEKAEVSLYEVFNSPNPVRSGETTAFYFKLAGEPDTNGTVDSRVQASIRIHTMSGKLVRVLRTELSKATQPRPRAVWDLRDSFGSPLANGLYPYTVVLRAPNAAGTGTTEIVRKGVVAISR